MIKLDEFDLMENLSDILWDLPVICVIKDYYGAFVYANKLMAKWFAEPTGGFFGKTDYHFMQDEDAAIIRSHDKEVLSTGIALQEVETVRDDGIAYRYFVTKFRISANDEFYLGVIGIPIGKDSNFSEALGEARAWAATNQTLVEQEMKRVLERLIGRRE